MILCRLLKGCFPRTLPHVFETHPLLADRPVVVTGEDLRQALPYQFRVDQGIAQPHEGHRSSIALNGHGIDLDPFGEEDDGGDVFRLALPNS
jgi:hypothetical protein